MNLAKKGLIIFCAALTAAMPTNLFAVELTEEQIGNISSNCSSIKLQLQNVQRIDAKSRVHLGAQFEAIANSLMMNLNLRLVKNNKASGEIAAQQAEFSSVRERFKRDYIEYQKELETLIAINCKDDPYRFYEQLEYVRARRDDMGWSINRLREIADEHRQSVQKLKEELYGQEHPNEQ